MMERSWFPSGTPRPTTRTAWCCFATRWRPRGHWWPMTPPALLRDLSVSGSTPILTPMARSAPCAARQHFRDGSVGVEQMGQDAEDERGRPTV